MAANKETLGVDNGYLRLEPKFCSRYGRGMVTRQAHAQESLIESWLECIIHRNQHSHLGAGLAIPFGNGLRRPGMMVICLLHPGLVI